MKEQPKYYTPEIEEFHVGFECQVQEMLPSGAAVEWVDYIYTEDDSAKELLTSNDWYEAARVKQLDREDIESLGFEKITDDCYNMPIKEFRGMLDQEVRILVRKTLLIYLAKSSVVKDDDVLFTGTIRNKSELKKILQMIGVIQ